MKISQGDIEKHLNELVKLKIMKWSTKGYMFDKRSLREIGKGIVGKDKYQIWIEVLWRAGYFETPRPQREINLTLTLLMLEKAKA